MANGGTLRVRTEAGCVRRWHHHSWTSPLRTPGAGRKARCARNRGLLEWPAKLLLRPARGNHLRFWDKAHGLKAETVVAGV